MNLQQILNAISNRIVDSSPYLYECYGSNEPRIFQFSNINEEPIGNFVVDVSGKVYEVTIEITKQNKCYRWIDADFKEALFQETIQKGFDPKIAWEDSPSVKFIEVKSSEDILTKIEAICNNVDFDEQVILPLNLTDEQFLHIAKMAHERDITFNEMLTKIIDVDISKSNEESTNKNIIETILNQINDNSCCKNCITSEDQQDKKDDIIQPRKKKFSSF